MRILMISDHADPMAEIGSKEAGGQNIYVHNLSMLLARAGHFVDVYTRWDKRSKKEIISINHHLRIIRVKAGPKRYMPRDRFLEVIDEFTRNILRRIVKENLKYDLIHTNYWFSGISGLKISSKLKIPQVHVHHSIGRLRYDILKKYKLQKTDYELFKKRIIFEQKIAERVDKVIATSPVEKRILMHYHKIPPSKISVIPIGVDTNDFSKRKVSEIFKKIFIPVKGKQIILYVGRIEWRKGICTLLYALPSILKDYPNAELLIVGGGKTKTSRELEREELSRQEKIIDDLRLNNKVLYCGPVSQKDLSYYYNLAEVCVVPSYYEPFGIVPLESMACGTPVVAAKTGGLQYTVKNKVSGYLAKPRDYKDLARKIKLVLKMGKARFTDKCIARVTENFTWQTILNQYLIFISQITKQKERNENSYAGTVRRVCTTSKVRRNRISRL